MVRFHIFIISILFIFNVGKTQEINKTNEICNLTSFPHDYYRMVPSMVPYQFNESYEVIEMISNSTGAKCLECSNYKFYFHQGEGEGLNKFMIFFFGAGFCGSDGNEFLPSCLQRISNEFGSSSTWGDNGSIVYDNQALGYFSSNKTHNEKFWNWNKIS